MVERANIKIKGVTYPVERILKEGTNYIKIRDWSRQELKLAMREAWQRL